MMQLKSTNKKNMHFTQQLLLVSKSYIVKEHCCLYGLDHLYGPLLIFFIGIY